MKHRKYKIFPVADNNILIIIAVDNHSQKRHGLVAFLLTEMCISLYLFKIMEGLYGERNNHEGSFK